MTKEQLLTIGLSEEQADKVLDANKSQLENFIPKLRFNEVNETKKQLEKDLKDRDSQLENLKKANAGNEDLQKTITQLQEDNQTAKETYEKELSQLKLNNALDLALTENKAKNIRAVKALLDLEKVKIEDGKVVGLDEQLNTLKEKDSYLFDVVDTNSQPISETKPTGFNPANPANDKPQAIDLGSALAGIYGNK